MQGDKREERERGGLQYPPQRTEKEITLTIYIIHAQSGAPSREKWGEKKEKRRWGEKQREQCGQNMGPGSVSHEFRAALPGRIGLETGFQG